MDSKNSFEPAETTLRYQTKFITVLSHDYLHFTKKTGIPVATEDSKVVTTYTIYNIAVIYIYIGSSSLRIHLKL